MSNLNVGKWKNSNKREREDYKSERKLKLMRKEKDLYK